MPDRETTDLLRYFAYAHLPVRLQVASKPFHDLAGQMAASPEIQDGEQLRKALEKLLEAKDCYVRSRIPKEDG